MINIGILGCGRIGQVHVRSLSRMSNARVVAVSDPVSDAAQTLAASSGAVSRDTDAILSDPGIDAVIIGTPTSTHYELIHAAAGQGKAIFCEKPIDLSVARIRDCLSAIETAAVPMFVAFNRRFDPNFAHLHDRIQQGDLGEVELVTLLSRDPAPPPIEYIKSSGGLFRDMMIHDFDMARFLLGEEPVELVAHGACLVDPEIGEAGDVDTAGVMLKTKTGKICQISNSRRASYGYDQRIEVHGSQGMARADNQLTSTVEIASAAGFTKSPAQHFFLERYEAAYAAEMRHFVACLENGTSPSPNGSDGLSAQILADAADLSHREGRAIKLGQ